MITKKVVLINYANEAFKESQKKNTETGKNVAGFDKVYAYSPKDIDRKFYKENRHILLTPKGNGYWLWKPYFIKKTLELLNEGDYCFYCDAGSYFINSINSLIEISQKKNQDILVFETPWLERQYTKRDAFILLGLDEPKFTDSYQRLGGFSLWRKSPFAMNLINEWLLNARNEKLITDIENQCGKPNYPEFVNHRHDQSIFSLITKKYAVEGYRDFSQFGNKFKHLYSNSPYEQIVELTRQRNLPKKSILKKIKELFSS